jgi:nuclear pore complex protein Nup205
LKEDDEQLFDQAIAGGALKFLQHAIVLSPAFSEEEYYIRRIHSLVTGLLVNMPQRVKKLRNENDETARIITLHIQQGVEPREGLRHDFEDLMRLIGEIYMNDALKLQLEVEYWGPSEPSLSHSVGGNTSVAYQHQTSQRQVSLYKFVRLAGDLLPSSLFTPYLNMLFGLSNSPVAAHHCYNMLKANSASLGAGTASSNVSWDHFFLSMKQYYLSMKQDAAVIDGAPIHSLVPGVIATDELEGLHAVLRLLRQIVKQDEPAGIALYDSQYWLPIPTLVQLVGCPVPLQLKANLLLCLSAFALIPDIAGNLWHMMESQQFLQTVPPQQGQQQFGIKVELEEIESCAEEYPETRAFMALLDSLTNSPIPPTLGAGYREPGFDPYLEFLRDSILLKFDTRAYHNAEEKWLVCASVLELLHKLLNHHNPAPSHFAFNIQGMPMQKPPGHTIMIHLLKESPFLGKILSVIDAGAQYAVEPVKMSHSGQNAFERSVLLALRIVDVMLIKQSAFFEHLRAQNSSMLATPIEQLLLAINPRTGRPDHFVNIAWLVSDHGMSADLCLTAVKILCSVCKSAAIHRDIVQMWTISKNVSTEILQGFVTRLENNDPEHLSPDMAQEEDTQAEEDSDETASQISSAIRLHIVHLMQISLTHSAPNVAHFLLGFELTQPVSQTSLQDPGVRGSPRTCLHVILDVLSEHITVQRLASSSTTHKPQLAEACYSLIYSLCSDTSTSQPTVRYLRTSHDFFYQHLESLPFPLLQSSDIQSEGIELDTGLLCLINQQAWLLKLVALELRLTAMNRQHFHTQRLITSLLSEGTLPFASDSDQHFGLDVAFQSRSRMTGQGQNRLLRVLSIVQLNQEYPPKFELQFFDTAVIENVVTSLESSPLSGGRGEVGLCDIRSLNRVLMDELNSAQGIPIAQRSRILEEIRNILRVVAQRNSSLQTVNAKRQLLNGWRQIVEVLLVACPIDLLDTNVRRSLVLEVIQELLLKVSSDGTSPQLAVPLHGILMTLVAQLRRTVQISSIPTGTLHSILRGLIEQLVRSSSGQQQVRSHIYSALLYYLQATSSGKENPSLTDFVFGMGGGVHGHDALESGNLAILSHYGDSVMEVVCRDACDGSDIIRMLAFAVLDCIVAFDWQYKWLNYMAAKGYLRHCINSLVHEDASLQATLARNPEPLKALYIYESKMAFFTRLAQFSAGAQALLHSSLFARLSECGFLDMRPETSTFGGTGNHALSGDSLLDEGYSGMFHDSFAPAVSERYHQLLFPALRLVQTILNSLGKQQRDASLQAFGFVSSHSEVVFSILKERSYAPTLAGLEEVSLVTGLVHMACVGLGDWVSGMGLRNLGSSNAELHASLTRIQRLMLSLLIHYCMPDSWDKLVKNIVSAEVQAYPDSSTMSLSPDGVVEASLPLLQQITSNVVAYCRHVMTGGSVYLIYQ